jgi:hypothetical protein
MSFGKIWSASVAGAPMPAQKAACSKRLSAGKFGSRLGHQHYPPVALTYIKGTEELILFYGRFWPPRRGSGRFIGFLKTR